MSQTITITFCQGFSECRVFPAGMKIVMDYLESGIDEKAFKQGIMNNICIFKAFGVIAS
jgi:hypothetical protein